MATDRGQRSSRATATRTASLLAALLLLGAGAAGHAASILSVGTALGAGHDTDLLDNTGPDRQERTGSLALVSSDAGSFLTRFAATLAADAEPGGSNQNLAFNVDYTISILIDAAVGETWDLSIDHSRHGALTLVDDDAGRGQVAAQDVFVTVTGATLTSGVLDLPAVGNLNGASGGYLDISQTSNGLLSGIGPQTVTLQFSFLLRARSNTQGAAGDEASVRLGLASVLDGFTAGDYPGIGARSAAADGHRVSAQLVGAVSAPEPGPFISVSLGLLGLALLGRSRDRISPVRTAHRRR